MKFQETFCSQCGQGFGPGDSGFSACKNHMKRKPMKVGEHVKFNKKLPRLAHCRGFITAIDGMIVKMHWYEGAEDGPMHTLLEHLELAGKAPQKIVNKDSLIV